MRTVKRNQVCQGGFPKNKSHWVSVPGKKCCERLLSVFVAALLAAIAFCSPAAAVDALYSPVAPAPGSRAIPSRGQVRIPVIFLAGALTPAEQKDYMSFFSNSLDSHTFRNYWYVNSRGKYDVRCHAVERPAPEASTGPEETPGAPPAGDGWYGYFSSVVAGLAAEEVLRPELFDSAGPGTLPDGWMDGAIVFGPGFTGATAVFPPDEPGGAKSAVKPGPFVAAGPDATASDVLRAFAELLGFRGDTCLSILSPADKGFPLLDAYNRTAAGWAEVMEVKGTAQNVLLLPALASGKVYRFGGEKEYFLVENRGPAEGYDLSLLSPGLAVYHIIESAPRTATSSLKWYTRVVNVAPEDPVSLQPPERCIPDSFLFREGQELKPDYLDQNPAGGSRRPANSNWSSGEPSDLVIRNVDTISHYPIITALFEHR